MNEFKEFLTGKSRQWLMGFAILWVIAFHFTVCGRLLRFPVFNFLFGKGCLGVDIFIFLSCYGLCHSYERRGMKGFYRQRVRRLFPVYLLFLIALVLFFPFMSPFSPIKTLLLQASGLSSFFGMSIEWYIPALIAIYAFFPLIYKGVRFLYNKGVCWVMALVFLLIVTTSLLSKYVFILFVLRLPLVILSVALFFALKEDSHRKLLLLLVSSAVLGFCFVCTECHTTIQYGLLMLPLILYALSQLRFSLPLENVICFCGRHSLEIYLAQNLALNQFYASTGMGFVPKTFVAVGLIFFGSFVLWGFQTLSNKILFK